MALAYPEVVLHLDAHVPGFLGDVVPSVDNVALVVDQGHAELFPVVGNAGEPFMSYAADGCGRQRVGFGVEYHYAASNLIIGSKLDS
jgi:hypothetical protein